MAPTHIAVLGGGLTGLSSAFHLSRKYPTSLITLVEKNLRLGGWVQSDRVDVRDREGRTASIVIEAGPRTLRPNSKAVLELIHLLNLEGSLVVTPSSSPAARNRFLYISPSNDTGTSKSLPSGLVKLPSSVGSLLTSPLARGILLPAILREPFTSSNRPTSLPSEKSENGTPTLAEADDESFDAFCTRRFGPAFARTFASALVHGIYATDSRNLSVRAAFPSLWDAERLGNGRVVLGFAKRMLGFRKKEEIAGKGYELGTVPEKMKGASVFSFRDGIAELTSSLEWALEKSKNVRLLKGTEVRSVDFDRQTKEFKLNFATNPSPTPPISHLVSALPLPYLASLLPSNTSLPHLQANRSSSVTLMNLIFPVSSRALHPAGFGYLIPRPANGYGVQHPGILGTVFDSCALSAQDVSDTAFPSNSPEDDSLGFTKMTVMLGGPHPLTAAHTALPTVLTRLAEHLGRDTPLPDPVYARTLEHKDCIPTLTPGHLRRMDELRAVLHRNVDEGGFAGRLEVVGAGVGGVSVGDCVEQGRKVGAGWS